MALLFALFILLLFLLIRIIQRYVLSAKETIVSRSPIRTLCILGSGGHTMEMIELLKTLDPQEYNVEFIMADSDQYSKNSVISKLIMWPQIEQSKFHTIPRSRKVHQSYFTSIFTTLYSIAISIFAYHKIRPELILSNGPGTAIPLILVSKVYSFLFNLQSKVFFVESIARVKDLSLSGKIIYRIGLSDKFLVQWPQLQIKYPKCEYISRLL